MSTPDPFEGEENDDDDDDDYDVYDMIFGNAPELGIIPQDTLESVTKNFRIATDNCITAISKILADAETAHVTPQLLLQGLDNAFPAEGASLGAYLATRILMYGESMLEDVPHIGSEVSDPEKFVDHIKTSCPKLFVIQGIITGLSDVHNFYHNDGSVPDDIPQNYIKVFEHYFGITTHTDSVDENEDLLLTALELWDKNAARRDSLYSKIKALGIENFLKQHYRHYLHKEGYIVTPEMWASYMDEDLLFEELFENGPSTGHIPIPIEVIRQADSIVDEIVRVLIPFKPEA